MRRELPDIPYGREDFLYFVLSCNESVESVINHSTGIAPSMFSNEDLSLWTIDNWNWAVAGVVTYSQHINILYSHPRILNHALAEQQPSVAHFRKELPIYDFYKEHCTACKKQ